MTQSREIRQRDLIDGAILSLLCVLQFFKITTFYIRQQVFHLCKSV